jgi:molecular chaperone GrpE (heat shock protein)
MPPAEHFASRLADDVLAPRSGEGVPGGTSEPRTDDAPGDLRVAPDPTPHGLERREADRQAGLRALRSLEATEVRLARNAKRDAEDARGKLVQELLPVLDNLDRTIRAAHGRSDPAMLEGVRMVRQQLEGVLRGYGVERIDATGARFDPGIHEAIGVTPVADPQHHGLVLQQHEPGYRFGERLLRPARIHVGKLVAPVPAAGRAAWR